MSSTSNPVLDRIMRAVVEILNEEAGYCGCAIGNNMAMLNSSKDGIDFKIDLSAKKEDE